MKVTDTSTLNVGIYYAAEIIRIHEEVSIGREQNNIDMYLEKLRSFYMRLYAWADKKKVEEVLEEAYRLGRKPFKAHKAFEKGWEAERLLVEAWKKSGMMTKFNEDTTDETARTA